MAAFIARLFEASGVTLPADAPEAFPEDDGSGHERAIDQLAELGIFTGYPDGRSGAKDRVDRAQMASLLDRALAHRRGAALPEGGNAFPDDDASAHAAAGDRPAAAGIAPAYADGPSRPSEALTRQQRASFPTPNGRTE